MPIRPVYLVLLLWIGCQVEEPTETSTPWPPPTLTPLSTGADSVLFIGIHPVDAQMVWISGTHGTYARTTDGGATWRVGTVPGADTLQFRDVYAADAETVHLLSIGPGASSRIYRTTNGGAGWTLAFINDELDAFYDCMDFWDAQHGIAFSDAVDGAFPVIVTADSGATWQRLPADALPPALPGEGSFAASGTCLVTHGDSTAWFGTAVSTTARVFKTTDRGQTWTVTPTPLVSGETAGIASLAFLNARHGAAFGGDLARPEAHTDNVAVTHDGGQTWTLAGRPVLAGAVYGAAYVPDAPTPTLVAAGPDGLAYSTNDAQTWTRLDTLTHWSVAVTGRTGWAIGPEGRVTRLMW